MIGKDLHQGVFVFRLEQRIDRARGQLVERFIRRSEDREGARAAESVDQAPRLDRRNQSCMVLGLDRVLDDVLGGVHGGPANHGVLLSLSGDGGKANGDREERRCNKLLHLDFPFGYKSLTSFPTARVRSIGRRSADPRSVPAGARVGKKWNRICWIARGPSRPPARRGTNLPRRTYGGTS